MKENTVGRKFEPVAVWSYFHHEARRAFALKIRGFERVVSGHWYRDLDLSHIAAGVHTIVQANLLPADGNVQPVIAQKVQCVGSRRIKSDEP